MLTFVVENMGGHFLCLYLGWGNPPVYFNQKCFAKIASVLFDLLIPLIHLHFVRVNRKLLFYFLNNMVSLFYKKELKWIGMISNIFM